MVNASEAAVATRMPRRPGVLALLLATLTMIGPFSIDMMFPAFVEIEQTLGVDAVAMQQAISVYLLAFAAMSLFHGPVSDAVGRKPVIIGGSTAYVLASTVCAVAPSMAWLLAGRAMQGLCAGAGMIVARTIVRDVFDGQAAQRVMSHMSMIFGVAPALAPIVGGMLLGWSSWRSIFWFLVGFGLLLLVGSWVLLPETHPPPLRTPFRPSALLGAMWSMAKDPSVARLCAVSSFNFGALFTYIAAAPAIVVTYLHLGEGDFGVWFVPIVTAMIFGSFLTGRLAGRLRRGTFITMGFASSTIGGALQVLGLTVTGGPQLPWVLVGPVLTALGIALVFPIVTLVLLDQRPSHRGTASSLQTLANTLLNAMIAGLVVPLVVGSMTTLALTAVGFTLAAWSVWLWHRWRLPAATAPLSDDSRSVEPTGQL
ncbi:MAG: multidrug effflux MFS transporter [Dermatophilaceae bacterium]